MNQKEHSIRFRDKIRYRLIDGMTIVEVLVVIAIIGILFSLLLPAVQSSRELSRRLACQNNLKGLGLAAANFEIAMNRFPPGYVGSLNRTINDANCTWLGSLAYLLPHLEHAVAFRDVESSRNTNVDAVVIDGMATASLSNWWARRDTCLQASRNRVSAFNCPSDIGESSSEGTIVAVHTWMSGNLNVVIGKKELINEELGITGSTNYVGSSGLAGGSDRFSGSRGVLFNRSKTKHRDVLDGTTNTLLYGEITGAWKRFQYGFVRTHSLAWMGGGAIPIVHALNSEKRFDAFGSLHPSGVVSFVFVDGSVRSLSRETSLKTLISFASMANNDVQVEFGD